MSRYKKRHCLKCRKIFKPTKPEDKRSKICPACKCKELACPICQDKNLIWAGDNEHYHCQRCGYKN